MGTKPAYNGGGYADINFGVHKIMIVSAELKEYAKVINIDCEIKNDKGTTKKFVRMATFFKPTISDEPLAEGETKESRENEVLAQGLAKFTELNNRKQDSWEIKDKDERRATAKAIDDEMYQLRKVDKAYSLVASISEFEDFISNFGQKIRAVVNETSITSLKETLQAYVNVLQNTDYAYAFIMKEESEYNGKVTNKTNLSQNFQRPQSWSVKMIKSVETVYDDNGDISGFELTTTKDKKVNVKRNARNFVVLEHVEPNDEEEYVEEAVDDFENVSELLDNSGPIKESPEEEEKSDDLPF